VAGKLADYIIRRWSEEPDRTTDGWISVYVATTGLEEAMLALHEQSGDKKYLDFCINHRKLPDWNVGIIEGRWGNLEGHAYHYLCRCLAQLRLNNIQPDPRLLTRSRETLDFLLKGDGLLIPGLCGYHECWHSNQQGFFKLGETCTTAYLIRWLDALLQVEGDSLYGDVMERAIYNGLFAAQSPDGRRLRYYAPFEGPRIYFDGDTYRAVYTVKFKEAVYVLHSFQKKSKKGIKTPPHDIKLIKARFKEAEEDHAKRTKNEGGKAHGKRS